MQGSLQSLPTPGKKIKVGARINGKEEDSSYCVIAHCDSHRSSVTATDNATKQSSSYYFDWAFDARVKTQELYEATCRPLIDAFFAGFNATYLAYGQSGSGKTHTLDGVIHLALQDIFERRAQRTAEGATVCVKLTYIEVYQEKCFDLLAEVARAHLKLTDVRSVEVDSVQQVMGYITQGGLRRTKGSTSMNTTSSRSHAICTISLRVSGGGAGVTAKLHLVDLAGSEGLEGAEGLSRKEGISINQGLLTLRMVVSARALKSSGKGGQGPAPYRESKLTHLLKDALGDNALTVLLACVSPTEANLKETINTLKFAQGASTIVNHARVNHIPRTQLKAYQGVGAGAGAVGAPVINEELGKENQDPMWPRDLENRVNQIVEHKLQVQMDAVEAQHKTAERTHAAQLKELKEKIDEAEGMQVEAKQLADKLAESETKLREQGEELVTATEALEVSEGERKRLEDLLGAKADEAGLLQRLGEGMEQMEQQQQQSSLVQKKLNEKIKQGSAQVEELRAALAEKEVGLQQHRQEAEAKDKLVATLRQREALAAQRLAAEAPVHMAQAQLREEAARLQGDLGRTRERHDAACAQLEGQLTDATHRADGLGRALEAKSAEAEQLQGRLKQGGIALAKGAVDSQQRQGEALAHVTEIERLRSVAEKHLLEAQAQALLVAQAGQLATALQVKIDAVESAHAAELALLAQGRADLEEALLEAQKAKENLQWTDAMEIALQEAVGKLGRKWVKVAMCVNEVSGTKVTGDQCRGKYGNLLKNAPLTKPELDVEALRSQLAGEGSGNDERPGSISHSETPTLSRDVDRAGGTQACADAYVEVIDVDSDSSHYVDRTAKTELVAAQDIKQEVEKASASESEASAGSSKEEEWKEEEGSENGSEISDISNRSSDGAEAAEAEAAETGALGGVVVGSGTNDVGAAVGGAGAGADVEVIDVDAEDAAAEDGFVGVVEAAGDKLFNEDERDLRLFNAVMEVGLQWERVAVLYSTGSDVKKDNNQCGKRCQTQAFKKKHGDVWVILQSRG